MSDSAERNQSPMVPLLSFIISFLKSESGKLLDKLELQMLQVRYKLSGWSFLSSKNVKALVQS